MSHSRVHSIWCGIKKRCYNENIKRWNDYGGRGITMAPEWRDDFLAFYAHVGPCPSPNHSIDRIKNELGYEIGNVRWATPEEQARNTTKNAWVNYKGERRLRIEVCEELGFNIGTINSRAARGCTEERLFDPIRYREKVAE